MIEWIRNIRQSAFETLHGVSFTCWFFESERNVKTGIRTSPVLSGEIMADPCVTNSANAYRRDWVNRRKTTLNKLTALADMRHSRMLYDNIKETIAKLKQSAEGELQDLHPRRDRQVRARQMVGTRSWRESLPTPWNPPPPPSPSSTPPSALAPRSRHRRRSLQPPSRPRAPWWTPWSRPRYALTPPHTIWSNGRGNLTPTSAGLAATSGPSTKTRTTPSLAALSPPSRPGYNATKATTWWDQSYPPTPQPTTVSSRS